MEHPPPPEVDPGSSGGAAPWWFEQGLLVVTATVVAWGGAGLLLADHAAYSLPRAAALGSVGTVIAIAVAYARRPARPRIDAPSAPAIAMIAGAGVVGIWNSIFAGHHVSGERDPGIYLLAGKWIAKHGGLIVHGSTGWPLTVPQLTERSAGIYQMPDRTLQFQFAHFLPSLLAEGDGIGGDRLMFRVNAIIGALALLVLFAVGCRLCRHPWLVAAAVLGLGVSIPEINGVRDTFSEPSTQLVLWTGIWLLILAFEHRRGWRHLGVALLGGAALGATVMTRIDGMAYFIFVPPLAAFGWLARARAERRNLLLGYLAVLVGAIPFVAIGTFDVQRRAGYYYHDLHHDVFSLYAACAVMAVGSAIGVVLWPRLGTISRAIVEHRVRLGAIAAAVAATGMVLAWSVRPAIQKVRLRNTPRAAAYVRFTSGLQRGEGLAVDGLRTYGERSVEWLSWYLGPIALILAIAGLAFVVISLSRRPAPAAAIVFFIAGPASAEYLWNSHITGDQPWAMRRFLPAALPLCALLAAAGASVVRDFVRRAAPTRRTGVAAAVLALGLIAFPIGRAIPVQRTTVDAHFSAAIDTVCKTVGPHAAVLIAPGSLLGDVYTQTIRDWCNVPTERLFGATAAPTVTRIAAAWKAQGRTLWVLGPNAPLVQQLLVAGAPREITSVTSPHEIEVTLARPPEQYRSKTLAFWGAPVS